mgnify:CR=1 FL=1
MLDQVEVWRQRVAQWRASGLSMAAFCREQRLAYWQMVQWRRRLGGRTGKQTLVPVVMAAQERAMVVEFALPCGVALKVATTGPGEVAALVRALSC